jgi:hypothetical protein
VNVALAVVCAVAGHKWAPGEDVHEGYALLRCRRCHAEMKLTSDDRRVVPWTGRRHSPLGRWTGGVGRDGRPE